MKLLYRYKYIIFILFFASVLRLAGLGTYPPGPTNDEVSYFYNAYSIAETGKNVFGQTLPFYTVFSLPFMPVSTYLIVPFVKILGLSLFSSRLPFALLGILQVPILYWIIKALFKSERLALLSALALAISPWHIHESRIGYEAIPSLFFYLSGILVSIWAAQKSKPMILSLPLFLLALFSYRAHVFLFLPIIILLIWYLYPLIKGQKKDIFIFFVGSLLIIAAFLISIKTLDGNFSQELVFAPSKIYDSSLTVDNSRTNSAAPEILNKLFISKATLLYADIRNNYFHAFSTDLLITSGEANGTRSMWTRGLLYTFEVIFVILGLFAFFREKERRREVILVLAFILIGPIPSAISSPTYSMRSIFMLPFLLVVVAHGWLFVYDWVKRKKIVVLILSSCYLVSVASFSFQYFFRYPIYASGWWFTGIRDAFSYIDTINQKKAPVYFAADEAHDVLQYAFYHKTDPHEIQKAFTKVTETDWQGDLVIDQTHFIKDCRSNNLPIIATESGKAQSTYLLQRENCPEPDLLPIKEIKERGSIRTVWWIYKL